MVNMVRTVFFADVLGFSSLSRSAPEAAVEALTDIAILLSDEHPIAQYLNRFVWDARYALSDSIFLVGTQPAEVCRAVAEFFFNLAFYVAEADRPLLLRGAVALGDVRYADPIFPKTATSNLVGEAVVEAVTMEHCEPKGPRLFVSERVAAEIGKTSLAGWLLSPVSESLSELLWLLPAEPERINQSMLQRVCQSGVAWFRQHGHQPGYGSHYLGYMELIVRSLLRLKERAPEMAEALKTQLGLPQVMASADLPASPSRERLLEIATLL